MIDAGTTYMLYEMWNRKGHQIKANEIQMGCASFLFFYSYLLISLVFLRQDLNMYLWLSWSLAYNQGWPQGYSTHLTLGLLST